MMAFETREQWQQRVDELVRRADTDDVPQPKPEQPIVGSSDGFTLGPGDGIAIPTSSPMSGIPRLEERIDALQARAEDVKRIADALEDIAKSNREMAAAVQTVTVALSAHMNADQRKAMAEGLRGLMEP